MTGFKPQTSGIGSDRSTNLATQPLLVNQLLLTYCFVNNATPFLN